MVDEPGVFIGKIQPNNPTRAFLGYVDEKESLKKILTAKSFEKLPDQIMYPYAEPYDLQKHVFSSCDILESDELGYLYFKDRTGDTFRWKGENVSTSEVEAVISNVANYRDTVVYGVENVKPLHISYYRDGLGWLQLVLSPVRADKTRALPTLVGRGVHANIEYCDSTSDCSREYLRDIVYSAHVRYLGDIVYTAQVQGMEGRAGMAAILDPDESLNLRNLAESIKKCLPSYARPLFVRALQRVDVTGTYKLKKKELQNEGFDPTVIKDRLYYLSPSGTYELLTEDVYNQIFSGKIRL
uniref:Uncharacterized protein n=1 Tax=Timema poppense TaxID=170557 RepID=A0A7R9DP42_TIMPO|nr:unnamed protein product [Timema poppensis]